MTDQQPLMLPVLGEPVELLVLVDYLELLTGRFAQDPGHLTDNLWELTDAGYTVDELCSDLLRLARLLENLTLEGAGR